MTTDTAAIPAPNGRDDVDDTIDVRFRRDMARNVHEMRQMLWETLARHEQADAA